MRISILAFFCCVFASAQTLKVNENKLVSVVFDSNIIQGAVGNDDYSFNFNPEGTESVALLQATKKGAKPSNLVVKTSNGILYNINIEYSLDSQNIVKIKPSEGISLTNSTTESSESTAKQNTSSFAEGHSNIKRNIRENDYTIGNTVINDAVNKQQDCGLCDKIFAIGKNVKRINSTNYNIKLDLENVAYSEGKIYVSINIINNSNIDYNINYIKSYVKQSKEKASSNQYLEKNPIQIFNSNREIPAASNRKFIFVYDQFTIDKNKTFVFELNEANGERNQTLYINNFIINNPLKI